MGNARRRKAELRDRTAAGVAATPAAVSSPAASRWLTWAAWALILAFYFTVRIQLLDVPLDRDEGGVAYIGEAILRGELPYRDFFDHKPPGYYYLWAAAMLVFPASAAGVHSFLLVVNLIALAALAYVAWKLAGERAALWTAFLYTLVSAAPSVQGFTASAELLGMAPLAGSVALAVAGMDRDGRRRDLWMLAAGLLAGFAFLIKPPLALTLVALLFLIRKRDIVFFILGGAILGALVAVWFVAHGAWSEFWYWNATHNVHYRDKSWDGWRERLSRAVSVLTPDLALPILLGVAGCAWAFVKKQRYALFLAVFFAASILGCVQAGYLYMHYFAQMTAGVALAAGIGCAALIGRRPAIAVVAALVLLAVPVSARRWYWIAPHPTAVTLQLLGPQAFEASQLVADHLREQTKPGDSLWLYSNEAQIPLLAERRNANPYLLMYPMLHNFPRSREFQERAWKAFQEEKPAYLLITTEPALMLKLPGADPFLEQRLQEARAAYQLESCLALTERGLLLQTGLDRAGQTCPGDPVFELWKRR